MGNNNEAQNDFEEPLLKMKDSMRGVTEMAAGLNKVSSAKSLQQNSEWLHDYMKHERNKAIREREVQDSILAMNELQGKTNTYLEQSHKLQDLHVQASKDQVAQIASLVEEQKLMRREQLSAKRSNDIQFWLNVFVVVITALGFALAAIQFYQTMNGKK